MAVIRRDLAAIVTGRTGRAVIATAPAWFDAALCAQTDHRPFFPEKGGSVREAKQVCAACPVRDDCLATALANDEKFGVWGGLTERNRRKLLKEAS